MIPEDVAKRMGWVGEPRAVWTSHGKLKMDSAGLVGACIRLQVGEGCAKRKWNGETEATQSLAYVVLKSAINNNSLIHTAIPQKGLGYKGPKPPKYPSNLSCQNSRKPLHQEVSVLRF